MVDLVRQANRYITARLLDEKAKTQYAELVSLIGKETADSLILKAISKWDSSK